MPHHRARRQSQVASDFESLRAQQLDLVVDASAVIADRTVGFDHAMARHENRNWIRRHRGAYRALSVRLSRTHCQPLISDHRACGNLSQQQVRVALEVALDQAQIYRALGRLDAALEHAIYLSFNTSSARLVLDQVELPAQQLERALASADEKQVNRRETAIASRRP